MPVTSPLIQRNNASPDIPITVNSAPESAASLVMEEKIKASFADRWIKPAVVGYVVTIGSSIAMPHFIGQTIGRIPVVSDWIATAFKTVFEKAPTPVLDMLMTAGNFMTYKSVKSLFVQEQAETLSRTTKMVNIVIFWGSAALVGYSIRAVAIAAGHIPEEGMMLPLAAILQPEDAKEFPAEMLANAFFCNQNIMALTTAAQMIVTPVLENRIKSWGGKAVGYISPYIRQSFFAADNPVTENPVAAHQPDAPADENSSKASYSALPSQ